VRVKDGVPQRDLYTFQRCTSRWFSISNGIIPWEEGRLTEDGIFLVYYLPVPFKGLPHTSPPSISTLYRLDSLGPTVLRNDLSLFPVVCFSLEFLFYLTRALVLFRQVFTLWVLEYDR